MTAVDASVVFLARRAMTMQPPGQGIYHLPRSWTFGSVTRCGIVIWAHDQRETQVIPIRRDTADRIARLCEKCAVQRA